MVANLSVMYAKAFLSTYLSVRETFHSRGRGGRGGTKEEQQRKDSENNGKKRLQRQCSGFFSELLILDSLNVINSSQAHRPAGDIRPGYQNLAPIALKWASALELH